MISLEEMAHLSVLYAQKHRHYHDITHVMNCLAEFEAYRKDNIDSVSSDEAYAVTASIRYHDAVYNPYSTANEFESSNLVPYATPFSAEVRKIVQLTKEHLTTLNWDRLPVLLSKDWIRSAQIMLDIDLVGFGKSWQEYKRNGDNIRKEYYNTSDEEFFKGRLNFLNAMQKRMIDSGSIYYTPYFHNNYNLRARSNIQEDIDITTYELEK